MECVRKNVLTNNTFLKKITVTILILAGVFDKVDFYREDKGIIQHAVFKITHVVAFVILNVPTRCGSVTSSSIT